MASSAGKRGAGLAAGFLDKQKPDLTREQPSGPLSLEDVVKLVQDLQATVSKQAGEIATLKKLIHDKDKRWEEQREQARQVQDKLARDTAALAAVVKKTTGTMAQLEKAQELHAQSALACTVVVHAYRAFGKKEQSADSVKANLMQPCGLPCTEVLSCMELSSSRRGQTADAVGPFGRSCVTFKVVLASAEAATRLLINKTKHQQLRTGLVVRQALTRRERAVQQAFMPLYRSLKESGTAVDFRRGRLFKRVGGKWMAVDSPKG